ncbi:hypothetical protein D1007_48600 [Hordeum vulgare]|nr:hypothetical protein D1007_48600 [Hordeum vulgare]
MCSLIRPHNSTSYIVWIVRNNSLTDKSIFQSALMLFTEYYLSCNRGVHWATRRIRSLSVYMLARCGLVVVKPVQVRCPTLVVYCSILSILAVAPAMTISRPFVKLLFQQ